MGKKQETLLTKYFENRTVADSNIRSFENFIDYQLQQIVKEVGVIEPTIIPSDIETFQIKLDKIWITKPEITEADGSKRSIFPMEARLRKITYAATIHIEVSAHINGIQRESFTAEVGSIPIMVKSKYCNLYSMNKEELIVHGEDPTDIGGYFVINGSEKTIITIEDLASNRFVVEKNKTGTVKYTGKLFSEHGALKIPHTLEKHKDGIFYLTCARLKSIPVVVIVKALGITKDQEIMENIGVEISDNILVNLYEFIDVKTEEDAKDYIAKKLGITQPKEQRIIFINENLNNFLLPNIGVSEKEKILKAKNLCKLIKKYISVESGKIPLEDKDHYKNKRLKLCGELLSDLFRMNLRVLINDILYNFQRIVRRGKFPSIKVIIRDKLLTSRIYSAMATGNWVGGRKGVSQRIQRINYLDTLSHIQRVISPLSTSQENFEARELHCTHLGRLCPIETPEGTNIGLRKNLSMLTNITQEIKEDIMPRLKELGLKTI
ncbi:MAG: DNA-directed RNA polymerase subunit B'' [Candidatus Woesearchaeota archaeon]|jgi:DNA-directed RNA polymerase beta subunit